MASASYEWAREQAFCVTVVRGLGVDDVRDVLGGSAKPGTVTGLEFFNLYPEAESGSDLVALLPVVMPSVTTTVLLENNGFRGITDEVLARLASGGYALSVFQNVNLLIFLYGAARPGTATTQTLSEDWAQLRQLRVDEPLPLLPAGSALDAMRDIGFLTQERAEAMDDATYLPAIGDFWPKTFEFVRRATGVNLTDDLVLGPGHTVLEVPALH